MDKADIEGFVERGIARVKAELGAEPYRATPHWDDIMAAVRALLHHLADDAKHVEQVAVNAYEARVHEAPFAPTAAAEPDTATE